MKKVMISQPMKGKTKEQIYAERELAVKELRERGYEEYKVIDTVFAESPEEAQDIANNSAQSAYILSQLGKFVPNAPAAG